MANQTVFSGILSFCTIIAIIFLTTGCERDVWQSDICITASQPESLQFNEKITDKEALEWVSRVIFRTPIEHTQVATNETPNAKAMQIAAKPALESDTAKAQDKRQNSRAMQRKEEIPAGSCIDINQADIRQLMQLPGVGQAKAQLIVKAREKRAFKRKSDITRIKGIGKKMYQRMSSVICDIG